MFKTFLLFLTARKINAMLTKLERINKLAKDNIRLVWFPDGSGQIETINLPDTLYAWSNRKQLRGIIKKIQAL